ncbi:hypothetical protein ACFYZ8_05640 [Streptomyces sp. NPDC001668]|uniref:hypothetical protein n=1 Tax=unclassified Streptomyces TaxID=2593676 RepID=UPI003406E370
MVTGPEGERLLSRRALNDEPALLKLVRDVLALSQDVQWAMDDCVGGKQQRVMVSSGNT